MSDMNDLLKKVYEKNDEFGSEQVISHGEPPQYVLMIDKVTRKPVSPQMRALYGFAIEWKEGLTGLDVVDPNLLPQIYENENIKESIELKAEYYRPVPPSDPSDWEKTALLAVEAGGQGLGLCFYWWRLNDDVEPCIISIDGGDIKIFSDLTEHLEYLANGTFPEKGDAIYTQIEAERGTLRD